MILPETAAQKLLVSHGRVVGVRTGDKGRNRDGGELGNFEAGSDLVAKVTVLAEGTQGHLTGVALDRFGLRGEDPQVWELGVKEVWKVAKPLRRVIHTMGWPLRTGKRYREFGGSFIYPLGDDMVTIGLVVGLDYRDASLSVHDLLQELKTHPKIREDPRGRRARGVGREDDPERRLPLAAARAARAGAAPLRRRSGHGQHPAPQGRPLRDRVRHGSRPRRRSARCSAARRRRARSRRTTTRCATASSGSDLYEVRNMRQVFGHGFFVGGALASAMTVSKGRIELGKMRAEPDADQPLLAPTATRAIRRPTGSSPSTSSPPSSPRGTRRATTSRTTSGSSGGCRGRSRSSGRTCAPRRCTRWGRRRATAPSRVELAPSNCVQCGAITAKGGRLTPPEGGSGPEYTKT